MKIFTVPDGNPHATSSSKILDSKKIHSSFVIDDCFFEADKSSSSSLFYVRGGKKERPINLVHCTFTGKLPKGAYHIDGNSLQSKKEKLMIKERE